MWDPHKRCGQFSQKTKYLIFNTSLLSTCCIGIPTGVAIDTECSFDYGAAPHGVIFHNGAFWDTLRWILRYLVLATIVGELLSKNCHWESWCCRENRCRLFSSRKLNLLQLCKSSHDTSVQKQGINTTTQILFRFLEPTINMMFDLDY